MFKKGLYLILSFLITISCFKNKIKEIKDFSFEKLKTNQISSQVNSNYLEGINPIDLEVFLLENNFQKKTTKKTQIKIYIQNNLFFQKQKQTIK